MLSHSERLQELRVDAHVLVLPVVVTAVDEVVVSLLGLPELSTAQDMLVQLSQCCEGLTAALAAGSSVVRPPVVRKRAATTLAG